VGFLRVVIGLLAYWLILAPAVAREANLGASQNVSLTYRHLEGVQVTVVTVDLNSKRLVIKPIVSRQRKSVHSLLASTPLAAVTGTFFDMKTGAVVGSLASGGRLLEEGSTGSTLAIDTRHRARLLTTANKLGRYVDWTPFEFAISCGPTLVQKGRLAVSPWQEGFRDPGLFGPRRRTALGVTKNRRLLMVGVEKPVSIHKLARIMRGLGAVDAINLDGGTSATLYYKGQLLMRPHRTLTNLVAIYELGRDRRASLPSRSRQALSHYQRGFEYYHAGLPVQARSHFSKAVAFKPNQASYHSALAAVEADFGHIGKAVDHYLRASRLYLAAFKPEQALTMARKATANASWRTDAQLLLGRAALHAGQKGLAKQALKVVLQHRPGHPEATRLLELAKSGRKVLQ